MKKSILLLAAFMIMFALGAQTWKTDIERISGKARAKTLKMNSNTYLRIQTHTIESDSTVENISYEGNFISGSQDSIQFTLNKLETTRKYTSGVLQRTTIPPKHFLKNPSPGPSAMRFALSDIDYLKYEQKNKVIKGLDHVMEPLVFASLFMLALSPILSYDFKEGGFHSNRYKYWAIGSTIGITVSLGYAAVTNSRPVQKQYQFNSDWPDKQADVWKFK